MKDRRAANVSAGKRLPTVLLTAAIAWLFAGLPGYTHDSAYDDDIVKSWPERKEPNEFDKQFLNRLHWKDYKVGNAYVLRTGIIYGRWIAAIQFIQNGKLVMTEYTPPSEYITVLDPSTGCAAETIKGVDANHDSVLEMAFLHEKLTDENYHLYTVYALNKDGPKLLWKSAGRLGDWLRETNEPAAVTWTGKTKSLTKAH